jgi:hypothetical protein
LHRRRKAIPGGGFPLPWQTARGRPALVWLQRDRALELGHHLGHAALVPLADQPVPMSRLFTWPSATQADA